MGVYSKARLFGAALPTANTNLLATDIRPNFDMSEFRVHVACSKAGKLHMKRTDFESGLTLTEVLSLTQIGADEGWTYYVPVRVSTSYNFSYSVTNGTIFLQVDEVAQ